MASNPCSPRCNGTLTTLAIGDYALAANKTGSKNIALGQYALTNNVNGTNNIALGSSALSKMKVVARI